MTFDLLRHPGEDSQLVGRQVKEAESETASTAEAVAAVRGSMERALAAWEAYSRRLPSLQAWLAQEAQSHPEPAGTEVACLTYTFTVH